MSSIDTTRDWLLAEYGDTWPTELGRICPSLSADEAVAELATVEPVLLSRVIDVAHQIYQRSGQGPLRAETFVALSSSAHDRAHLEEISSLVETLDVNTLRALAKRRTAEAFSEVAHLTPEEDGRTYAVKTIEVARPDTRARIFDMRPALRLAIVRSIADSERSSRDPVAGRADAYAAIASGASRTRELRRIQTLIPNDWTTRVDTTRAVDAASRRERFPVAEAVRAGASPFDAITAAIGRETQSLSVVAQRPTISVGR